MKKILWLVAIVAAGYVFVKYTKTGQSALNGAQSYAEAVWNDPDVRKSRKQGAKQLKKARKAAEKFLNDARH